MEVPVGFGGFTRRAAVGLQTPSAFSKVWKALHADRTRINQISVELTVRQGNRLAVAILGRLIISSKNESTVILPEGYYQTAKRGITFSASRPF
jgi:hypothetical protein